MLKHEPTEIARLIQRTHEIYSKKQRRDVSEDPVGSIAETLTMVMLIGTVIYMVGTLK